MVLNITDTTSFINNFLSPISKLTNSIVLNIDGTQASSLISTPDNTIILNSSYTLDNNTEKVTLNIPDLNKLIRILSVIESPAIGLKIDKNSLSYSSDNVRFKYHLYEDGIIVTPKLNMDKLKSIAFDGEFSLPGNILASLIKGSTIATESNKIYLSFTDTVVTGELTDKQRPNVDSYGLKLSTDYKGPQLSLPIPLNFEIFRIISSMRVKSVNCKFNTKMSVFLFTTSLQNTDIKFVVSALAN